MWTYILGPFLALLPKNWRDALSFTQFAQVGRATALSGLCESIGAIVALGYWYMYAMSTWTDRGVESALSGRLGVVTDRDIASVVLTLYLTHPLTWLLGYFMLEGAVRFCGAAFSENILGALPLFLLDKILISPFRRSSRAHTDRDMARGESPSLLGSMREGLLSGRRSRLQDEITLRKSETEEFLEVFASHRKDDWIPPRIVRYAESYYRLESSEVASGSRPFRYKLRRLSAGVPSRSVLLYSPGDALIRQ